MLRNQRMCALYSSRPLRLVLQRSAAIACRPQCSAGPATHLQPLSTCALATRHLTGEACASAAAHLQRHAATDSGRSCSRCFSAAAPTEGAIIFLPHRDISIGDLASRLPGTSAGNVMVLVSELGIVVDRGPETIVSQEVAEFVVTELGFVPQMDSSSSFEDVTGSVDKSDWSPRPPVVTIMGHVDHGKTTLLDYLRNTSVAAGEAGGITQHIGAFQVKLQNMSSAVTFLDTPGHAAFTAMRSRGTLATDVVVLVVAADDGVMPQTVESIHLAQHANVPIVVAVNKCDLHNAKPLEAKAALLNYGLQLEEFGGDVVGVEISALKGTNVAELQEAILVTAELADLRAKVDAPARGLILETKTKQGLGMVATGLVRSGTLKPGDSIMAGLTVARVRMMQDHNEKQVKVATPSMPVQIVGWKAQPHPGDTFSVVTSEKEATEQIQRRCKEAREKAAASASTESLKMRQAKLREMVVSLQEKKKELEEKYKDREKHSSLEKAYRHEIYVAQQASRKEKTGSAVEGAGTPELCAILKADVQGSIDALNVCISKYKDERAKFSVVHKDIGNVTPGDVQMARLCKANIYCLNTQCDRKMLKLADREGVSVYSEKVIYKLMDTMRDHIDSIVEGDKELVTAGVARVQATFHITGTEKRHVAGCLVTRGRIGKEYKIRVYRGKEEVHHGRLGSIRHLKDEVAFISADMECGLSVTDVKFEFEEGDRIESYYFKETKRPVDWKI